MQDEQTVVKLRERISQLDLENTALANATHSQSTPNDSDVRDLASVMDEFVKLLSELRELCQDSDRSAEGNYVTWILIGWMEINMSG